MSNVKRVKSKPAANRKAGAKRPQKVQALPAAQSTAATAAVFPRTAAPQRLSNVWTHLKRTLGTLRSQWRFFAAFAVLYLVLSAVFVHNYTQDIQTLKAQLSPYVGGNAALTGAGAYAFVITASGSSGATTAYLYTLLIICSLACIWALRKGGDMPGSAWAQVRNSFYEGMYPLVPFLLVVFVLTLELFPMAAGTSLLSLAISNGIASTGIEQALAVGICIALTAITVRLISMSAFALYIVTLPGGRPWQALKDSKKITEGRRLAVVRRMLFFGLVLIIGSACLLIPVIMVLPAATGAVSAVLGAALLPFVHAYFYGTYRELING